MRAIEFITGAMQDLGVLALGQTLTGGESADALTVLNNLADALGIDRLLLYKIVRTPAPLSSSTASYTIGVGGDIDVIRPLWIERAGLVLDTTAPEPTEIPISVLTDDEYARWPQKTMQASQSQAIWYDRDFDSNGYGRVYPLPIPDVASTQLVLYIPGGQVSAFDDLTTDYTFPKGYTRAIRKALALELAPMYPQATVSAELRQQAQESMAALRVSNVRPMDVTYGAGLAARGGRWNIETDEYR